MVRNQTDQKIKTGDSIIIILLSILGLLACIIVLFPQERRMFIGYIAEHLIHKRTSLNIVWDKLFSAFAMFGICCVIFFDYTILTNPGRLLVQKVKQEMKNCLSEINFRLFLKPALKVLGVYLLGIFTIIRANFLYKDDILRAVEGSRQWFSWSRYVSEILSIFVHGDTNLTDISPLPQLLAVLILSFCSVLLVYVIGNRKITLIRLLASIPLGLSPFFLECLSYKFDAPYMALSILSSIFPFLFMDRKKAFIFCSVISLLIMCMTYQAASGIYLLIATMLCFQDWNSRKKSNKEIFSFLGTATLIFCSVMLLFRFFFMKPISIDTYASTEMHSLSHLLSGTLNNIKNYITLINQDLGMLWKIGILLVILFFITKSVHVSAQKKLLTVFVSILLMGISFILSYGVYSLLELPLYQPRAFLGFGVFLAIICVYAVSDYEKIAIVVVFALNWCFFVFAFSYGNALADQARYTEFRVGMLLHDLSALYTNESVNRLSLQIKNSIDYAPTIKNIAKHYPIIEILVPKQLTEDSYYENNYYLGSFHYVHYTEINTPDDVLNENCIDFNSLNLPVVLDSYYHTIHSDGTHILVVLKH